MVADARQYLVTGKSITGADYTREKFGPVPKPIMPIRDELATEGAIQVDPPRAAYEGWRFRSKRPPNTSLFSAEELQTVDWWIRHISDEHTADSISEESHDYAWEIAKTGEPLPFFAQLAERMREPDTEEVGWAQAVATRLGAG